LNLLVNVGLFVIGKRVVDKVVFTVEVLGVSIQRNPWLVKMPFNRKFLTILNQAHL